MGNTKTSDLYLEENTVRLVAAQVVLLAALTLFLQSQALALVLALDFAWRAFTGFISPLAWSARYIARQLGLKPITIFAPPKKFAAGVGFVFSLTTFFLLYLHLTVAAYITGGTLIFFAVLESVFRICAGCYVYDWVVVPFYTKLRTKSKE